jgi:hypothetical protein
MRALAVRLLLAAFSFCALELGYPLTGRQPAKRNPGARNGLDGHAELLVMHSLIDRRMTTAQVLGAPGDWVWLGSLVPYWVSSAVYHHKEERSQVGLTALS